MSTMTIEGPCWIRYNDGRVAWLQLGWRALMSECKKLQGMDLPGLSLGVPEPVWQPQTREEYEQAVWDAYRVNDRYSPFLAQCGLDGPDDFEAALNSDAVIHEGDGTENDMPILLCDHVLHTVTAFAGSLPYGPPS